VNLGIGCVIRAGSVVTKSMPPYVLAVGAPCKPTKKFSDSVLYEHLVLLGYEELSAINIVSRRNFELKDAGYSINSIIDLTNMYWETK
jgi:tetrahydrodipicolinate N-succinyltransferase